MFIKGLITVFILLMLSVSAHAEYITITKGATSQIVQIPVFDSSSSTGAMLSGLVYDSSGLTCYYNRTGAAGSATQIVLVSATKGTWTTGGFVAVDGTNMPGWYELHVPNAALVSGADSVSINCMGATNMVPVPILIKLADNIAETVWGALRSGYKAEGTFGAAAQIPNGGTAQAGTSNTITLATSAVASANYYNNSLVVITGGTGIGQARTIKSYTAGRVATVFTKWVTVPSTDSTYIVLPQGKVVAAESPVSAVSTTIATLASQTSFTLTDGSTDDNAYVGFRILITDATNAYQTALGFISAYTGSTKTVTLQADPGVFTMAVGDSAMVILDATNETAVANAVWNKTIGAEGSAVPSYGSSTYAEAFVWTLMLEINEIDQTSSTTILRNYADDDDIAVSTVEDNGTTFIRGKFTTAP